MLLTNERQIGGHERKDLVSIGLLPSTSFWQTWLLLDGAFGPIIHAIMTHSHIAKYLVYCSTPWATAM